MRMLGRRQMLAVAAGSASPAVAGNGRLLEVWRDPHCGCCIGWIAHMRDAGFTIRETVTAALGPVRERFGTPPDLLSCHAARVEELVLEGHVPALAVRRALSERPADVRGLAVPAMPVGAPGMEVPGMPADRYDVIVFAAASQRVFMRFRGAQPDRDQA